MIRKALLPIAVFALLLVPGSALADVNDPFNFLNGRTLGDAPYTGVAVFDRTAGPFNTQDFTTEGPETSGGKFLGCGSWGSKSAWVRFSTRVAGNLRVEVISSAGNPPPGHDVIAWVFRAPASIPAGTATHAQLEAVPPTCQNNRPGLPDEFSTPGGYNIPASQTVYVEVASVCEGEVPGPQYQCDAFEQMNAPGGNTSIRVRFTPVNTDGDGTADSIDNCTGLSNNQDDQDGDGSGDPCDPDRDGDGRANTADNCGFIANPGQENLDRDSQGDVCDTDRDGDQHGNTRQSGDCKPDNRRIHRDAKEIRGNRRDENCDGKDAPFLRVTTGVDPFFLRRQVGGPVIGIKFFGVEPVSKGMRVRVECRGVGCPSPRNRRVRKRGRIRVPLANKAFPRGTQITIKIVQRQRVGRGLRFTIDGRGEPRQRSFCLTKPNRFRPANPRYAGKRC